MGNGETKADEMAKYIINWTTDAGNGRGFQVTTLSGRFCGVFRTRQEAEAFCIANK